MRQHWNVLFDLPYAQRAIAATPTENKAVQLVWSQLRTSTLYPAASSLPSGCVSSLRKVPVFCFLPDLSLHTRLVHLNDHAWLQHAAQGIKAQESD